MAVGDNIVESVEAMRDVLRSARSNPENITLTHNPLRTAVNASLVGAVLVFIDRSLFNPGTLKGDALSFGVNIGVAASSLVFVVIISALLSLIRADGKADQIADRWSVLFLFIWLLSLLLCLIDLLAHRPVGDFISHLFGGAPFGLDLGLILALAFYVAIAYVVLFIRSYILEPALFSSLDAVWLLVVVPICVAMLYAVMKVGVTWTNG